MKKIMAVFLGVLSAIGGFVDMGDLVANAATGARFEMSLMWVVPVGVLGIVVYAEMAGRIAAVSGRTVFDLVRERLGPRFGFANLVASFLINLLTLTAELAGVAIALSLLVGVHYLYLVPVALLLVWLVIWRMPFSLMEDVFGLTGLSLIVFCFALWKLHPQWGELFHAASHPAVPKEETWMSYAYYGIALFGAAMTPYEVFFFSSGAVEDGWTKKDLGLNKVNVYLGFPLGGILSVAIMGCAAVALAPKSIDVATLPVVLLPIVVSVGKVGLALGILGIFAATFGAALETSLSAGYTVAQHLGWTWGKNHRPGQAARFHVVVLAALVSCTLFALSGVDAVKVTEYSIVLSAAALPLTYLPILLIANDPGYLGDDVNTRPRNALATLYLAILTVAALAALPLMIVTRGGS